jgi:hypothetical protein
VVPRVVVAVAVAAMELTQLAGTLASLWTAVLGLPGAAAAAAAAAAVLV